MEVGWLGFLVSQSEDVAKASPCKSQLLPSGLRNLEQQAEFGTDGSLHEHGVPKLRLQ